MYAKKKCMKCGQPATHKFTKIDKGQIYDIYLCGEHAAEESPYQKPKALSDILEGLLKQDLKAKGGSTAAPNNLRCPNCGLTFEAYRKNLMLGCSECYAAFHDFLMPDLRRFHGETHHHGRHPGGETPVHPAEEPLPLEELEQESAGLVTDLEPDIEDELEMDPRELLEELTRTMHKAIADEDYAKAARCRDQIRELKSKIKQE